MKKLSTAFEIVAWVGLSVSVVRSVVCALTAESNAVLISLSWIVGGILFYLFMLAYSYFLDVASDIKDRLKKDAPANQPNAEIKSSPVLPTKKDGYLICPSCGSKQRSGMTCLTCGAEFAKIKK